MGFVMQFLCGALRSEAREYDDPASPLAGELLIQARSLIALLASTAFLVGFSPNVRGQTYSVVLSVNDPRPMAEAVLSLIRSYPVTITYEDPRYEYAGDLRDMTGQVGKTGQPPATTIVPKGDVFAATYDVSDDTGQPVDMADAIQKIIDANNAARHGGHFELRRSGDTFHVVPAEIRDRNGHWIPQQSILDVPITFSSGGVRVVFELVEAILKEVSGATGQKIVAGRPTGAFPCSNPCTAYNRTVDATNEPAREVLMRLLRSINPRYTWVLYYGLPGRSYVFNLVLGRERPEPQIERPRPKPGGPTPGVPANLASTGARSQPTG